MSKKEELINGVLMDYLGENVSKGKAIRIYDEIRASILTPKVVALLKAIGGKPEFCGVCKWSKCTPINGDRYRLECKIQNNSAVVTDFMDVSDEWIKDCPLLTAEELKEIIQ